MKQRIKDIESRLTAFKKESYQRKELLDELLNLQAEMVNATFDGEHAERSHLKIWDIEKHFEQLNEDCGHVADELLAKFRIESKAFTEMIRAEISGNKGEQKAYKSLQTVKRNQRLLRNIELKNDEHRTEIDIISITDSTIFLIEVKNTSKNIVIDERGNYCRVAYNGELAFDKNIGEKMNEKEYLLREVLRRAGLDNIQIRSLVVFTNSSITVNNDYAYIQECYLSQLPHLVDRDTTEAIYNEKQVSKIAQSILNAQCRESYPIDMDIASYKNTFSTLMATLEYAKVKQAEQEEIKAKIAKNPIRSLFQRIAKVACLIFN